MKVIIKPTNKILVHDQLTQKGSLIYMTEQQAKAIIKRAVAVFGINVIPEDVQQDMELYGMLTFMSAGKNEAHYYKQLAKHINAD